MPTPSQTHYEILNLPASSYISASDVKQAYRVALLAHHPDKLKSTPITTVVTPSAIPSNTNGNEPLSRDPIPSIDQITNAYAVLSDAKKRAEYTASLKLSQAVLQAPDLEGPGGKGTHPGVETYDLDDLAYTETQDRSTVRGQWARLCRCGNEEGYVVREADLERASEAGHSEIFVGCRGCSLFIRVVFGLEEG